VISAAVQDVPVPNSVAKVVHATIKKVGDDIDGLAFNTAISQMMICTNALTGLDPRPLSAIRTLLHVLNPFAPHVTEELWERLNDRFDDRPRGALADAPWPEFDPALLIEDEIEMPVQINGKVRERIVVNKDASAAEIEAIARAAPKVVEHTSGKTIRKVVVVPGRLVNIVAG
jgi:leucyl-tRNA synthetase